MNIALNKSNGIDRRQFVQSTLAGFGGISLAAGSLLNSVVTHASEHDGSGKASYDNQQFNKLTKSLLVDWCDGMIRRQVNDPSDPSRHGALICPACSHIHGRCSDALYPFLHLAHVTGEQKYLDAAIN
ncbi:secreted protein, partial [Rhodopirellula maiorica SM1]